MEQDPSLKSLLADSLRAHMMKFSKPLTPGFGEAVGLRMLVAFLLIGVGVFLAFRLAISTIAMRDLPESRLVFVATLLAAFFVTQRVFVRAPLTQIGLRRFADWTRLERLYLFQVVPLATVVFVFLFRGHLIGLVEQHGLMRFIFFSVVTGLLWGMVQEFLYRGWLQTELTRRFGTTAGLLAANVVFTFGPLHVNYLSGPSGPNMGMLVAVFGIGLLFGILYRRSGNLWLPAVLHGLWPLNMT